MTEAILTATARNLKRCAAKALRSGTDRYGTISTNGKGTLAVRVSPPMIARAISLLAHVSNRVGKLGWTLAGRSHNDHTNQTGRRRRSDNASGIQVDRTLVAFRIAECSKERKNRRRPDTYGTPAETKCAPQGKLRFEITSYVPDQDLKVKWTDTSFEKLEDVLPEILETVKAAAASISERDRRAGEERLEDERLEQQRLIQEAKLDELEPQIDAWREANTLRAFIAEVKSQAERKSCRWPAKEVALWLEWAELLASESDPFTNGTFDRTLEGNSLGPKHPKG